MGLLDFGSNNTQSGGLLGDLDPSSKAMVAMALINKFANNNRGSESGFGDIFGMMMQQQQMKRQEMMDQLQFARFGMDQKEFGLRQKSYEAQVQEAQRKAAALAQQQQQFNNMAQGVVDYKAPAAEMKPVVAEYNQAPLMEGQSVQIPTQNYLNNMFSAADEARQNPSKGAFIIDPGVRQQAAAMIRTGDPQLVKQAYDLLQQGGPFTLGEGQTRYTGTGEPVAIAPNKTARQQNAFTQENKLRDEFVNQTKPFTQVNDSYGRILKSAENPSAAGDLALIFNYMKMLDPGSTVREGEFANAENSAGIPTWLQQRYNKAVNGERLTPEMRSDFVSRSGQMYESQRQGYDQLRQQYNGLANRYGLNPKNVMVDYEVQGRYNPQQSQMPSSATSGNAGSVRRYNTQTGRIE
jgi:hypothetical protein